MKPNIGKAQAQTMVHEHYAATEELPIVTRDGSNDPQASQVIPLRQGSTP